MLKTWLKRWLPPRLALRQFPKTPAYRPALERLEVREVPATIEIGFPGMDFFDGLATPPDTIAGVGPDHVILGINTSLAIYQKNDGTLLSQMTFEDFFAAQGADPSQIITDPLVIFDEGANRFVIAILGIDFTAGNPRSFCYFAVSNNATPTNLTTDFTERIQIDVMQDLGNGPLLGDYPKIGINADAYVITFNMFSFPPAVMFESVQVLAIDKASVLDMNPLTFTSYSSNIDNQFTLAASNMHSTSPGDPMWFVSSQPSGSTINVTRMTNVLTPNPTYTTTVLNVPAYQSINPAGLPQVTQQQQNPIPQHLLDLGDTRMMGSASRIVGGIHRLVATHHVRNGTLAEARWYEINITGPSPILIQSGSISPPNLHTYFPSIDIAANGDIGMTFMQSGPTEFISMYVTARTLTDPPGTMQTPVLAKAGEATLISQIEGIPYRVGDYSSVSVDPVNPNQFWAANEYAINAAIPGGSNWGTWIASFSTIGTDLAITKSDDPDPILIGETLTYTMVVTNNGPLDAPNTMVIDNLPGGVNIVQVTTSQGSFIIAGSTVTFNLGTLTVGNSAVLTIQVTPLVVGVIVNTATVSSSIGELDPSNNTAQTTTTVGNQFADVAIVKTGFPDPVGSGNPLTYILTVTNFGPQAALGVQVLDHIPSGLAFVSVVTSQGSASFAGGVVTAQLGTIANGGTATITITLNALGGGPKTNTATVSTTVTDPNPNNNTSSVTITVIPNTILVTGAGYGAGPDVRVYDNLTKDVINAFFAFDPGFKGGVQVAAGDVDGDGYPDVIVGAGPGGGPHVKVFDARTGFELASFFAFDPEFQGGVNVASGDVNGDGYADVIVSAKQGPPHVKVFLGTNFIEYYSFYAYDPQFQNGVWIGSGDLDADGKSDIITGPGAGGPPHVRAFSGADLSLLANYFAYDPGFTGGVFVAGGDVNGDGHANIITGPGIGAPPHITVFDYFSQTIVSSFMSGPAGFLFLFDGVPLLSGARVAAGDINGDGRADIFTATGPGQAPRVRIFNSNTDEELATFLAYDAGFMGGVFIGVGE